MSRREDGDVGIDLFTPQEQRATDPFTPDDLIDRPQLAGGGRPRGLMANGLVRTTGWLQLGTRLISTGLVAATIGLLLSVTLAVAGWPAGPAAGITLPLIPLAGYGLWRLLALLRPASRARNVGSVCVRDLRANDWIRVYGSIGPVGQVAVAGPGPGDDAVAVRFFGGATMNWPGEHRTPLVELSEVDTDRRHPTTGQS
jgi:hypothetical protein